MIFKLENYEDKEDTRYCMHCETEEEAKDFCKFLHSQGRKWGSGESYLNETHWVYYEGATCYDFNRNSFGGLPLYKSLGFTILEWGDFMEDTMKKEKKPKSFVNEIFKMLGVEPNEVFKIKEDVENYQYRITEDLNVETLEGNNWVGCSYIIRHILVGLVTIVKIPKITEEEQLAINYALACGHHWLAKDSDGTIYAYTEKPQKESISGVWDNNDNGNSMVKIGLPISFLSWEDEEPYYIGD